MPEGIQVLTSAHAVIRGLAVVLGIELATAVGSYLVIRLTPGPTHLRVPALFVLLGASYVAVLAWLSPAEIWSLGVLLIWLYGTFLCRFLSSIYFFARNAAVPNPLFHVMMLLWGPRQHYGAGSLAELPGTRFSGSLTRRWGLHFAYEVAVILLVAACAWGWVALQLPYRRVALSMALFLIGLELLEFLINLQFVSWAIVGRFPGFFGRFALFRAVHIGQWWQFWNVPAINLFREVTRMTGYGLPRFVNVMAVFLVSGLLHQVVVYFFTRHASYGTMLSFALHGVLVYFVAGAYQRRSALPAPLRLLLFNRLTSSATVILAALPFMLDFHGWFRF